MQHEILDKTTGIGISKHGEVTGLAVAPDILQSLQMLLDMWRGGLKPEKRRKAKKH